ncbi:uncharacterized protein LOC128928474 [Callithrix jacchus]
MSESPASVSRGWAAPSVAWFPACHRPAERGTGTITSSSLLLLLLPSITSRTCLPSPMDSCQPIAEGKRQAIFIKRQAPESLGQEASAAKSEVSLLGSAGPGWAGLGRGRVCANSFADLLLPPGLGVARSRNPGVSAARTKSGPFRRRQQACEVCPSRLRGYDSGLNLMEKEVYKPSNPVSPTFSVEQHQAIKPSKVLLVT